MAAPSEPAREEVSSSVTTYAGARPSTEKVTKSFHENSIQALSGQSSTIKVSRAKRRALTRLTTKRQLTRQGVIAGTCERHADQRWEVLIAVDSNLGNTVPRKTVA